MNYGIDYPKQDKDLEILGKPNQEENDIEKLIK